MRRVSGKLYNTTLEVLLRVIYKQLNLIYVILEVECLTKEYTKDLYLYLLHPVSLFEVSDRYKELMMSS